MREKGNGERDQLKGVVCTGSRLKGRNEEGERGERERDNQHLIAGSSLGPVGSRARFLQLYTFTVIEPLHAACKRWRCGGF